MNSELAPCAISGCRAPVESFLHFGGQKHNCGNFCHQHAAEVWHQVQGPVAAGLMYYGIDAPKTPEALLDFQEKMAA